MSDVVVTLKLSPKEFNLVVEACEYYFETNYDLIQDPVVNEEDKEEVRPATADLVHLLQKLKS